MEAQINFEEYFIEDYRLFQVEFIKLHEANILLHEFDSRIFLL
jgi:hypothetical protein